MTTVAELSALHRRYSDTSHRFRAAWTFHQFLQSLSKGAPAREDTLSSAFQTIYAELKEISQGLNVQESDRVGAKLEQIDRRLGQLIDTLDAEDTRVAPYFVRQFFRRVKTYDEKILTQLVKFYLYAQKADHWPPERLDKIDFLLARLSEEEDFQTGEPQLRDHRRLSEIFQGLWSLLGLYPPAPAVMEAKRQEIEGVRAQIPQVESLEQLSELALIRRYRSIKHELGNLFFEPGLLLLLQETNLALKGCVQSLYSREEGRIVAEYQRVFELEREVPVSGDLEHELIAFRQEIERFEEQLQSQELKLEDLAQIRQRVRALLPRLHSAGRGGSDKPTTPRAMPMDSGDYIIVAAEAAAESPLAEQEELLGEYFRRIVGSLRDIDPELHPDRVISRPEIFPYRLEPREVVAYRRLYGRSNCDRELEKFLLEAAALRLRVNEEAQEISGLLDETSVTGDSIVYARARWTARTADAYLWRFNHVLNEAVLAGSANEARQIQLLRMRLMRDYSGLWLLAYKPVLKHVGTMG
jgi:hypothetical protein